MSRFGEAHCFATAVTPTLPDGEPTVLVVCVTCASAFAKLWLWSSTEKCVCFTEQVRRDVCCLI